MTWMVKKEFHEFSVNFSVVSGGAALVAGSLIVGTGTLTPALTILLGKIFNENTYQFNLQFKALAQPSWVET